MRRQGGGGVTMQVVVMMVVMVMVNEIIAKPTAITHQHQEVNHVEDHYLDDALGEWLNNFGTYTFMVKQGLDTPADEEIEEVGEEDSLNMEGAIQEAEEELREEVDGEWSAPIAVSIGSQSLLDPRHDHLVTVESLVAEEGSLFLTLSKFENQTPCGVGGVTVEEEVRQQEGRGNTGSSFHLSQNNNTGDTFVAIDIQKQDNTTSSSDLSKWVSVSEQYWWARGQLSGGGILSITFTPPECGCLYLSTYFALPVSNMTLVVGPQAYPEELQKLLCVDHLTPIHDHEYNDDEEEEKVHIIQPSALVSRDHQVENEGHDTEIESAEETEDPSTKTKLDKAGKKMMKKKRKQMKRQRIRQAGRNRNNTKLWQKLRKRGRKGRRKNSAGKHHHHHHHHEGNETSDDMMEHGDSDHDNTTDHHEERLVDILLRDLFVDNTTHEEEETEESTAIEENEETRSENEEFKGEENLTPKQRRKNRKQRRKIMRKQKKKIYPSGVKFCCKQGVKHKRNTFELNSAPENMTATCDMSLNVVATFANHQFGTERDMCNNTFMTCCLGFTEEMWDGIKARKVARKSERKQRRKIKRKGRKQKRRQERRQRKNRKHTNQQHHEEPEEPTPEMEAEGVNHVETK